MKKIALLGSTGSIGTNSLKVISHLDNIEVVALAAHSNIDLIEQQAREFHVSLVAIYDENQAHILQKRAPGLEVLSGMEGLKAIAAETDADIVISAISGTLGFEPALKAIQAKKTLALANKEALVSGGELITKAARENQVAIIPIDSEHSALFQCLNGEKKSQVKRLILTASGGPFRNYSLEELEHINIEDALNHPNWSMGKKVTIDSSTLMNKGLEVIEAFWLFGIPKEKIDVVVHPQSIIHSMVEFKDHSIMAQMGEPSMITPIQYAITYPERESSILEPFDFTKVHRLDFIPPDYQKFPCLEIAFEAIKEKKSLACYMNAANESLVMRFLQKEISWKEISTKLRSLIDRHELLEISSLEDILQIDQQARLEASLI